MTRGLRVPAVPGPRRIQSYFRHAARRQYEAVVLAPFTLFFHPTDPLEWLNYAIPDAGPTYDVAPVAAELRSAFAARQRVPRIEFVEAFAPSLAASLLAEGFVERARPLLMTLVASDLREPPPVPGLTLELLTPRSPLESARSFVSVQRRAFGMAGSGPVSEADASWLVTSLGDGRAFLGRLDGQPVATGLFTHPLDGLTEIAGVATLEPLRRRGIGAAVTHALAALAVARGASAVLLSAADGRAGRVYGSVGFRPAGHVFVFGDPGAVNSPDVSP